MLKDRTWAFTNLPPAQFAAFLARCGAGAEGGWWEAWLASTARCARVHAAGAAALADTALRMALFDGCARPQASS